MVEAAVFYGFSALILLSALFTVTSKNVLRSAVWLAVCLLGVAAIFMQLNAYFIAGIQILLYVGAVVVLAIFVINLTRQIAGKDAPQSNGQVLPAVLVSLFTAALLSAAVIKSGWAGKILAKTGQDNTEQIGRLLLTDFVVPFEAVSVLLLAALIGAVVLVASEEGRK